MREWLDKHAAIIAFIVLALAGALAINTSAQHSARQAAEVVYHSQYKACLRGNELRKEVNSRVGTVNVQRGVLASFIVAAESARKASYKATHNPSDLQAAREYQRLLALTNQKVHYHAVPLVNCDTAVPKP